MLIADISEYDHDLHTFILIKTSGSSLFFVPYPHILIELLGCAVEVTNGYSWDISIHQPHNYGYISTFNWNCMSCPRHSPDLATRRIRTPARGPAVSESWHARGRCSSQRWTKSSTNRWAPREEITRSSCTMAAYIVMEEPSTPTIPGLAVLCCFKGFWLETRSCFFFRLKWDDEWWWL